MMTPYASLVGPWGGIGRYKTLDGQLSPGIGGLLEDPCLLDAVHGLPPGVPLHPASPQRPLLIIITT